MVDTERQVRAIYPAQRDDIGTLVTRRPLPGPGLAQLDPFLLLNHHGPQTYPPGNGGLPFGPHPHRGFETVTLVLAGELAHRDSAGHESVIGQGGVQWMTAGAGIVHSEVSPAAFRRDGGDLELVQLWINLPARLKRVAPRYVGLQRDALATIALPDGQGAVHLIAGTWGQARGPIQPHLDVFLATVELGAGATTSFSGLGARTVLLYVLSGALSIAGTEVVAGSLAALSAAGDRLTLKASRAATCIVGHAAPLNEPVVAHGPFVMNTRDEILTAIADYREGRFATGTTV